MAGRYWGYEVPLIIGHIRDGCRHPLVKEEKRSSKFRRVLAFDN